MRTLKISVLSLLIALTSTSALAGGWGAGVALFDGDHFGVHGRKTFVLGGDISQITTGASVFFDPTFLTLDADYHFVINPENPSRFYPLVGLQLATDFDWTEFGINAGGGVDFKLTQTRDAFFELKYVISDLDGFNLALGLKF